MKEYGYRKNEWCVLYSDECGDKQVIYFDLFTQANEFLVNIRKNGTCTIGVMTTSFYKNCVNW